jgi:hypothetical protein
MLQVHEIIKQFFDLLEFQGKNLDSIVTEDVKVNISTIPCNVIDFDKVG